MRASVAKVAGTTANVPAAPTFHDDLTRATERLQPVAHHGYSKVMSGAREGMYINETGNARNGQAFEVEYRGGRRCHVYGEGADRVVIAFAKPGAPAAAATATTPAAKTTTAVAPATTAASKTTTPAATTVTSAVASVGNAAGGGLTAPVESSG